MERLLELQYFIPFLIMVVISTVFTICAAESYDYKAQKDKTVQKRIFSVLAVIFAVLAMITFFVNIVTWLTV